jgi:hypothetical protein
MTWSGIQPEAANSRFDAIIELEKAENLVRTALNPTAYPACWIGIAVIEKSFLKSTCP